MITITNKIGNQTKVYAITFEYEAYDQIKKLADFEAYQNSKIRIMPDAHAGKGCTVGTTMTITDKITPSLVGVDVGCGMLTLRLSDSYINFSKLDEIINTYIPSGQNVHIKSMCKFDFSKLRCSKHVDLQRASLSLGSLGGGNHFIELNEGKSGDYYLVIHSGSRKLGGDVCKYYQDKAYKNLTLLQTDIKSLIENLKKEGRSKDIEKELAKIKPTVSLVDKDLAYLTGEDFKDYMNDMSITQQFASMNRETIAKIIVNHMNFTVVDKFETNITILTLIV